MIRSGFFFSVNDLLNLFPLLGIFPLLSDSNVTHKRHKLELQKVKTLSVFTSPCLICHSDRSSESSLCYRICFFSFKSIAVSRAQYHRRCQDTMHSFPSVWLTNDPSIDEGQWVLCDTGRTCVLHKDI